ncbi:methyltransferase protein [Diaporthe amygdali]|uniref:methyltransferase protein n=1 Tax=Phomopsis amygdali TaxID=1214568 RepID=UPI0022FF15F7|nr:methyltransferase protein [Diaporthe amygdali]KAJ0122958.1 methyltransferase protein [Diaporthe amygdali]
MTLPTDGVQTQGPWPAGESDERELAHTTSHASVQTPDRGDATTHDILVPDLAETDINRPKLATALEKQGKGPCDDAKRPSPADEDRLFDRERAVTIQYLIDHVAEFRELTEIRKRGWDNPEGDRYFERQRKLGDDANPGTTKIFFSMMNHVGDKMQQATGVFNLTSKRPSMLALGFAPGGFVAQALKVNPHVQVVGITLPMKENGMESLVKSLRLDWIQADVTMLAVDLGVALHDIPTDHPDAKRFLQRVIRPRQQFDLVTCEGGVLRTHQIASYRESREAHRLKVSQLAISLARVKPGGSMIMLMHKAETWKSLSLFYQFSKFSKVNLFKPEVEHQHRSSFYMIATNIQSQSEAAQKAVKQWTSEWKTATFGTDEEYMKECQGNALDVDEVLKEFGASWVDMCREVWALQIKGLERKSFTQ